MLGDYVCPECEKEIEQSHLDSCPYCKKIISYCDCCNNYVPWIDFNEDVEVCEDCHAMYFIVCEGCGQEFHREELVEGYCYDCSDEREEE